VAVSRKADITLKALKNKRVPVYGKGQQIREWLHVQDCATAIHLILQKGRNEEIYNIGSYFENKNVVTVKTILRLLKKSEDLIQFVKDRPGHDFRYSVNCAKLKKLGWKPKMNFSKGIRQTLQWSVDNLDWMEKKLAFLESYWKKVYKIHK